MTHGVKSSSNKGWLEAIPLSEHVPEYERNAEFHEERLHSGKSLGHQRFVFLHV
jgi:hypothetical protein